MYFTDVAHTINPYQVCIAIADHAKFMGTKVQQLCIETIEHNENNVRLSDGKQTLSLDQVLIATGAWSKS